MSIDANPGMAWRNIAASAYRAYAASTGGKNFRGDPMPEWGDLPLAIRVAWEAAVRHTGNLLYGEELGPTELRRAESRWEQFRPYDEEPLK